MLYAHLQLDFLPINHLYLTPRTRVQAHTDLLITQRDSAVTLISITVRAHARLEGTSTLELGTVATNIYPLSALSVPGLWASPLPAPTQRATLPRAV